MKRSLILMGLLSFLFIAVSGAFASQKCNEVIRTTCDNLQPVETLDCITKENHCPITFSLLSAICIGNGGDHKACEERYEAYTYFMDDECHAMKAKLKLGFINTTNIPTAELKEVIANACEDK